MGMTVKQFLIPVPGHSVRDLRSGVFLAEAGEWKPWAGTGDARYWRRRVKDGSVRVGKPPKSAPAVPKDAAEKTVRRRNK